MSRLLVLGRGELTLWRRDRMRRSWPLDELLGESAIDLSGCDGASLLVLSGSVQSNPLRVPELARADRRRFVAQHVAQHLAGSCGGVVTLAGLNAIQRIDGAAGLDVLLARLQVCGCRIRRVRHVAQLAEVVSGCLREPPAHAVVGWVAEERVHLSAVREGVVVWHRSLVPDCDLEQAFEETAQHLVEHGLFDRSITVRRVWLDQGGPAAASIDLTISLDEFQRAMRCAAVSTGAVMSPVGLARLLASARSELKTPPIRSAWHRRTALRGVASAAGLGSVLAVMMLWRAETAFSTYRVQTARAEQVAGLAMSEIETSARLVLAERTAADGARAWREWRRAVRAVALALTDVPALRLVEIAWHVEADRQHPQLRVVLEWVAEADHAVALQAFASTLKRGRWVGAADPNGQLMQPEPVGENRIEWRFAEQADDEA